MRIYLKGNLLNTEGPKTGMLTDFYDIKQIVNPIVDKYLDHHYLNDSTGLEKPYK